MEGKMDPSTGLTILGTAIGSAKIVEKLLGPTADYIGKGLENWTKKRMQNVSRIISEAKDKLGDKINEPGEVSPKVLRIVLNEGSFCDDGLTQKYFGGVLASSRTSLSRDDRGAYFLNLVSNLSNYQIRSHYIFYTLFRKLYREPLGNLSQGHVRREMRIHLPLEVYAHAMDFSVEEDEFEIATHSLNGLMRELLIDNGWSLGLSENYVKLGGTPDLPYGIIYATSITGIELYLWAMGKGFTPLNSLFAVNEWLDQDIEIKPGAIPLPPLHPSKPSANAQSP
jgi:hypothetical protein